MQFILMRKADADTEGGVMPSEELLGAMADYNARMTRAGVFLTGNGIKPSKEGCRISFRDGKPHVTRGPFDQTSELLAGYSVLEADSLEEAIEWAKQWPREDAGGNANLELRPYFTMEDFEPGEALDKHYRQQRLPSQVNVHVSFGGNCREAMNYYAELTGGHLESILTYGETPAVDQVPEERRNDVIHASLNLRGTRIMGADVVGDCYQKPVGAQIHMEYDNLEQAEALFSALSEKGEVTMPFEETFWAHRFGMLTDRFGIQWMISCQTKQCL